MKNTIISCVVAVLCTVAICVTYAVNTPKPEETKSIESNYISEKEAAEYIGVTDEIMLMMRDKLRLFEGTYMSYSYVDDKGETVTFLVYDKDALDEAMDKVMKDQNKLNFKYIQDIIKAENKADKK